MALLERLQTHFKYLDEQIGQIERELCQQLREDEHSQRFLEIPGIGPITASVLMTSLGDAQQFGSARQFAASVGLVPRQVQHRGQTHVVGCQQAWRQEPQAAAGAGRTSHHATHRPTYGWAGAWVRELLARRHSNVVTCTLANKLARIASVILSKGTNYRSEQAVNAA